MSFFATSWVDQAKNLLPPVVRNGSFQAFIQALFSSIIYESALYLTFETLILNKVRFNGQKMVLQGALNYLMGITVAPFIYISVDRNFRSNLFVFSTGEVKKAFVKSKLETPTTYVNATSESPTVYAFTVYIPIGIYTSTVINQVTAYTKLYKLAGKRFNVTSY